MAWADCTFISHASREVKAAAPAVKNWRRLVVVVVAVLDAGLGWVHAVDCEVVAVANDDNFFDIDFANE